MNRFPPAPDQLNEIYSFENYWHTRQRAKGHPSIESRLRTDRTDGRLDYWIGLIRRLAPRARTVVEVGCAHGSLLGELEKQGLTCVGVEPDAATAAWAKRHRGLDVRAGFFPEVELPASDLFLAFDVLEHSPDPCGFVRGIAEHLTSGGVAIIQTPIDRSTTGIPFERGLKAVFDDLEHLFLFIDASLARLAEQSGLEVVEQSERMALHHEINVFRKP